jgi:hypothetical protein
MNIQLIIVIIIGLAVAGILLRNVYRFFFVEKKDGYCGGCTGCSVSKKWNEDEKPNPYTSYLD